MSVITKKRLKYALAILGIFVTVVVLVAVCIYLTRNVKKPVKFFITVPYAFLIGFIGGKLSYYLKKTIFNQ